MNAIERAIAKGARFLQTDDGWVAQLHKRGRALPIATMQAKTKEEAAEMWLRYKEGKQHDSRRTDSQD